MKYDNEMNLMVMRPKFYTFILLPCFGNEIFTNKNNTVILKNRIKATLFPVETTPE